MSRILLHTRAHAYRDNWHLGTHWRAAVCSFWHPGDQGPELVFPLPKGLVPPGYYPNEALVELDTSAYREDPEHPLRLELRRVLGTGVVETISHVEDFTISAGWDRGVRFEPEAEQGNTVGWRLHVFGPWGDGAIAGGTVLVQAYVDCLPSQIEPGDGPP